jgi:hypothetical protein
MLLWMSFMYGVVHDGIPSLKPIGSINGLVDLGRISGSAILTVQ